MGLLVSIDVNRKQSRMKAVLLLLGVVVCCMTVQAAPEKRNIFDTIINEAKLLLDCGSKGTQDLCDKCCQNLDGHWDGNMLNFAEDEEIQQCKNACTLLP